MKKCRNCGWELPEDSVFCQYCGVSVNQEETDLFRSRHGAVGIAEIFQSAIADDTTNKTSQGENEIPKSIAVETKPSQYNFKLIGGVLVAIIVLLVAVCGYLLFQNSEIQSKNDELNRLTNTYKGQISSLEKKVSNLEDKAEWYDEIVDELEGANLGYAASSFKTDSAVYIVSRDNLSSKIKLTTSWSGGGSVSVDYLSNVARVSFDDDTWQNSTSLTIKPRQEGVEILTFSNTANSKTFKVLIIVTD